jgi:integrase
MQISRSRVRLHRHGYCDYSSGALPIEERQPFMILPKGIQIRNRAYVAYVTKDGKPIRKVVGVVGCMTRKQLVDARMGLERQIRDGNYPPPRKQEPAPEAPGVLCLDLWNAYKKECETREVTPRMDRLKLAWKHLEPVFGSRPASSVKPKDIADYIATRRAVGIAAATCNREVAILKAAFRHGARLELVERTPMFPKKLKEARPRQGFVEESQYKVLSKNAGELWLRTFLALGFNFGWRKSEILNLRVCNVDLLDDWITLDTSKNGEGRRVKITTEIKALLTACIIGKKPNDPVLTRPNGCRVAQPRKDWYHLCHVSGLGKLDEDGSYKGLQMHDLRRSGVRRMRRQGISETVAMKISGHKTASVFKRYDITSERDLEQAAKLLDPSRQVSETESENRHETATSNFAEDADTHKSLI